MFQLISLDDFDFENLYDFRPNYQPGETASVELSASGRPYVRNGYDRAAIGIGRIRRSGTLYAETPEEQETLDRKSVV